MWLLVGSIACGTVILAPLGLVIIIVGMVKLHRAGQLGWIRPLSVSLLAVFALVDGGINWIGWSLDVFANHTHVVQAMGTGFGKLVDGGYYVNYNAGPVGGIDDNGEKAMALFSVLCIFPARAAATWAYLKLKRWGLRWMIITGWGIPIPVDRLPVQHPDGLRPPIGASALRRHRLVDLRHLLPDSLHSAAMAVLPRCKAVEQMTATETTAGAGARWAVGIAGSSVRPKDPDYAFRCHAYSGTDDAE